MSVDLTNGEVSFVDGSGQVDLAESGSASFSPVTIDGVPFYAVRQQFNRGTDEGLFRIEEDRLVRVDGAHGIPRISVHSICQDRRFMARTMPRLEEFFHYRNLDVSTLKELAKRWKPSALEGVVKAQKHTALADIHESIDELVHYRKTLLAL